MQKAALYIRVSTDEQTEFSPGAQRRALTEYAKKNNLFIPKEYIFVDEGVSGRKAEKRPAFMKMIATAKQKPKPFDLILVHKFDRFARSREDSVVYKSLLRKNCDIKVISITEQIEDDKFSVILEAMLEAMAEYYSLNLSEEVLKGMTEKARKGQYQAGAPLGYDMVDGKLVVNSETSKVIALIYDKFLSGMSEFAIARYLNDLGYKTTRGNKFESRSIRYILQNPIYCGYVRWNAGKMNLRNNTAASENMILEKGLHVPLITEEIYHSVIKKMNFNHKPKRARASESQTHWLSGLLRCSDCGSVLVSGGSTLPGFQCSNYAKGTCKVSHYIAHTKIESAVREAFKKIITTEKITYVEGNQSDNRAQLPLLLSCLQKNSTKEKKIKEAYINGIDSIDEYRQNKVLLKRESGTIKAQINQIENDSSNHDNTILRKSQNVYDIIISDASKDIKNNCIKSICEKIVYDKKSESICVYLYLESL